MVDQKAQWTAVRTSAVTDRHDLKVMQTKFILLNPRSHSAVVRGRTCEPRNMCAFPLKLGPRNAGVQNCRAWERRSHVFPPTLTPWSMALGRHRTCCQDSDFQAQDQDFKFQDQDS